MSSGLVWFRRDLRLSDNPAWAAATAAHNTVTALFVVDPALWDSSGAHRLRQLGAHLAALDDSLAEAGGRLLVRRGDPSEVVPAEASRLRAEAVYWNGDVTPYAARRDATVGEALAMPAVVHHGCWVHRPGAITTAEGAPYRVFTPFHRRWDQERWEPWPQPGGAQVASDAGEGLPPVEGDPLMAAGEESARWRLEEFAGRVEHYPETRDRPDLDATSRLSADLKFGTISPRTVAERLGTGGAGSAAFVRQLCWRDFYAQLMAAYPETVRRAMRPEYEGIAWRNDPEEFAAWQEGRTGYPIVDAGMRQLAGEGWMHNRVRMITASFLVKDLLIDWRWGERHFRRLLVDGDLPQNVGNWQWVAGTGADAAPYFRIFNPVTQSRKFDPAGDYIRRWVPELGEVPAKVVHAPWQGAAPQREQIAAAGYPPPLVDHAEARRATLAAYEAARGAAE